jgi:hypothetical protein
MFVSSAIDDGSVREMVQGCVDRDQFDATLCYGGRRQLMQVMAALHADLPLCRIVLIRARSHG